MNKIRIFIYATLLFLSVDADAGFFTSDGDSYAECMENRRQDIKNAQQASIAANYCRQKHPSAYVPPEETRYYTLPGTAASSMETAPQFMVVRSLINAIEITSSDRNYEYMDINITNRNDFNVAGLIIGIQKNMGGKCSWDEADYLAFYEFHGNVAGKMSGNVRSNDRAILKLEKLSYCVTGLQIYTTRTKANSFLKAHNIPGSF